MPSAERVAWSNSIARSKRAPCASISLSTNGSSGPRFVCPTSPIMVSTTGPCGRAASLAKDGPAQQITAARMLANRLIRTGKLRIHKRLVLQVEDHRLNAHTLQDSRKRLSPMVDPASGIERTSRSGRLLVALAVAFFIAAGL